MGDITKKSKVYEVLNFKDVEDLPPGWQFEINGKAWNFEELANWGGRENLAYWFSVVFWRSRSVMANETRVGYWYAYNKFWEFLDSLDEQKQITNIEEINKNEFVIFKLWLGQKVRTNKRNEKLAKIDKLTYGTRRKVFGYIKETIKKLISDGVTKKDLKLPNNSFSNSNNESEKTLPYSQSERMRIVAACNKEFDLIKAGVVKKHRQIYVPYILTLALRTGFNLQPLLDLTIESMKSGVLDGRLEISIKKNRGYSTQKISIDDVDGNDEIKYVSKRIGPLMRDLIKMSKDFRSQLIKETDRSLWLVLTNTGEIRKLNQEEIWVNIQRFKEKYEIMDDAGKPLQLNIRRMRPTFAHAMLRINGGDLRDLQKRLNHKDINTTLGYLDGNQEEFKSSFKFRGIVMQHALSGGSKESLSLELNCSLEDAEKLISGNNSMITGNCLNPLNSPFKKSRDNSPCTQFMSCFKCHNQVVMKEDAHKIFSFYWFLLEKKNHMPKRAWENGYEWIIQTIDLEILPKLGILKEIEEIKSKAKLNPFPAWSNKKMELQ